MSDLPPVNLDDRQDLEDELDQVIQDSFDTDWTSRNGAKAVIRWLDDEGLVLVRKTPKITVENDVPHGSLNGTIMHGRQRRRFPNVWSLHDLHARIHDHRFTYAIGCFGFPLRPQERVTIMGRIRAAMSVFTGRCDAVEWDLGQ